MSDARMTFDPGRLIQSLCNAEVDFVIIGGIAAAAHGLARTTYDLDLMYNHTRANCEVLAKALEPFSPTLRGLPREIPFTLTAETVYNGMNFTLSTTIGDIDLLGEVPGAKDYQDVFNQSVQMTAYGCEFQCASVDKLIAMKKAAGRARDIEMLAMLEVLRDNLSSGGH